MCSQRRLRSAWASESSLSAWWKLGSLITYWTHREDSDQTGRMPRLIWVFAGRTVILLVLSWGGSLVKGYVVNFISIIHDDYVVHRNSYIKTLWNLIKCSVLWRLIAPMSLLWDARHTFALEDSSNIQT